LLIELGEPRRFALRRLDQQPFIWFPFKGFQWVLRAVRLSV
jgi:hypothetical protein